MKHNNQPIPENIRPLWRYREYAAYLRISEDKARHDLAAGKIPSNLYIRVFGRSIRFLPEAVEQWARGGAA